MHQTMLALGVHSVEDVRSLFLGTLPKFDDLSRVRLQVIIERDYPLPPGLEQTAIGSCLLPRVPRQPKATYKIAMLLFQIEDDAPGSIRAAIVYEQSLEWHIQECHRLPNPQKQFGKRFSAVEDGNYDGNMRSIFHRPH